MKRSWYFGGAAAIALLALVVGYALGFYSALPYEASIPAHSFEQYTLFTWNTRSGDVCFAIMLEYQRPKFIHSWFPKRKANCGVSELKKALVSLPKDSYVSWETWPPKNFDYPPENVVEDVIKFAETNRIRIQQSPAVQ